MMTQREMLAERGVDHDKFDVFIAAPDPKMGIDDETTGIRVFEVATGNYAEKTLPMSRRQLSKENDTTYIDTIVELVHELEAR